MPLARSVRLSAACVISCVAVSMLACSFASLQARGQRLAFYTRQQRYRFGPADPRCSVQKHCNLEIPKSGDYSLNFIEFKDDGTPYEGQTDAALDQLYAALNANDGNVLVFIYIHGWHNSAEERTQKKDRDCAQRLYTGDVDKFRYCGLEILAKNPPNLLNSSHEPAAAPRIVGIYLAWHGWDFGWPPLVWVPSYYLRMPKARSIGLSGMNTALDRIFKAIDAYPKNPNKPHLTIAMGHSFGARALEAALDGLPKGSASPSRKRGILQQYREKESRPRASNSRLGPDPLPVDLVFYVNAATSNADTIRTQNSWDSTCKPDGDRVRDPHPDIKGCKDDPLYFVVSSRADILTAVVMPVANLIAMPVGFALRGANYSNGYHLISAANTPWMQTHEIPVHEVTPSANAPVEGFCFVVPAKDEPDFTYVVEPKPRRAPYKFWVMNSDHWSASLLGFAHKTHLFHKTVQRRWIISSHGDVWNTGVFNMVRSVIDTQTARLKDPSKKVACVQTIRGQQLRAQGRQDSPSVPSR